MVSTTLLLESMSLWSHSIWGPETMSATRNGGVVVVVVGSSTEGKVEGVVGNASSATGGGSALVRAKTAAVPATMASNAAGTFQRADPVDFSSDPEVSGVTMGQKRYRRDAAFRRRGLTCP